jgi:hypothetical protein
MDLAVKPQDEPCVRATERRSILDERLEHRLKIKSRAADDLKHFTRGGLLVQCFSQVTVTFSNSRTTDVLDRNHR